MTGLRTVPGARAAPMSRLARSFRGVLPRSVDPQPGESLSGYLLRLSVRLDRSPVDIGQIAGLTTSPSGRMLPGKYGYLLPPDRLERFAAAARLTHDEARALTLEDLLGTALPEAGPDGVVHHHALRAHWAPAGRTRACPDCLSDHDGATGYWRKTWRLPWHFACVEHRRLLLDACPACSKPYGRVRHDGQEGELVPGQGVTGLPVNACRANGGDDHGRHVRHNPLVRCGHPLGSPQTVAASAPLPEGSPALAAQQRLLEALGAGPGAQHPAGGAPLPAAHWFQALQALAALLRMARPDEPVAPLDQPLVDALADHARRREQAADDRAATAALVARGAAPAGAALTGALAVQALDLLDAPDWDDLVARVAPLCERARAVEPRAYDRRPDRPLVPVLQQLVQRSPADSLLNTWLVAAPPPYTRQWTFNHRHVRHRLTDDAYQRHLKPFAALLNDGQVVDAETRLRRASAVAVVQLAHATTQKHAVELLGAPFDLMRHNLTELDAALAAAGRTGEFRRALHAVAQDIENDPARPDHAARRARLDDWTIPEDDWQRLAHHMRALLPANIRADWHQRRLWATAIVWELATGGEMSYAPVRRLVPPDQQRHFGTCLSRYRKHVLADEPAGTLRLLADYADRVVAPAPSPA